MLVLGIESASDQCGCALAAEEGIIAEARLALPRRHAEALAPQMRFVCEQAGVALADIEVVAVDHGPGLYTGLRAGLATAKATAAAFGIGVVPVGSLEALAYGAAAAAQPGETVLSVLDARRGEVFWAWYRITAAQSQPSRPQPAQSQPAQSQPAQSQPGHPQSGQSQSGYPQPGQSQSGQSQPGHPQPAQSQPAQSQSGQSQPGHPQSGQSQPAQSRSGRFGDSAAGSPPGDPPRRFSVPGIRLVQLSEPQVGPPADLLPALSSPGERAGGRTLVVGDGAIRYSELLVAGDLAPGDRASVALASEQPALGVLASGSLIIAGPEWRFPSPASVALLGRERALAGTTVPPEQVEALYLRSPDAQPQPSPTLPDS